MDTLNRYREIIERALTRIVSIPHHPAHVKDRTVFDRNSDNYLIVREGWEGARHIDCIVVHLEIINGKVWIQEDGIEYGIATDLEAGGIPKSDIVLGFQPPDVRPFTEYSVA